MDATNILIYGGDRCQDSKYAITLLKNIRKTYTYVNLDKLAKGRKEAILELKSTGIIPESVSSIPIVILNGEYIGGYSELSKWLFEYGKIHLGDIK